MVLFYNYKFSNMGIQGNEGFFFCLKLRSSSKSNPKHTTLNDLSPDIMSDIFKLAENT